MQGLEPVFRHEFFLEAIVTQTTPTMNPVFRTEKYLAKIAGMDVEIPEPNNREEFYLAKIAGADVEVPTPVFRNEMYLAALCGMNVIVPPPVFRDEFWLYAWINGGEDPLSVLTGEIIRFNAKRSLPMVKLEAAFTPIQSGTGDPSPTNIRPISGHTGCDIFVKAEYDPQATPTVSISFGQTVYGGQLTVNEDGSGQIDANMAAVDLADLDWSNSTATRYISTTVTGMKPVPSSTTLPNMIAEQYRVVKWADGLANNHDAIAVSNDNTARLYLYKDATTQSPTGKIVFELATPVTIPLTASQINTLVGENVVWVNDSDYIQVTAYGTEIV